MDQSDDRSVFPGRDLCRRALGHVWVELGRPGRVDRLPDEATSTALGDRLLDALCSDPALRTSARRRVLPDRGPGAFRHWGGPERFQGRVDATALQGGESSLSRRRDLLGLGLLHPDDGIARRAAELIRRDWGAFDKPLWQRAPEHRGPEVEAAQRVVDELAGEWVTRWVEWGSRPPDRGLVEEGIRRCYELSGQRWHGRVIWVESPFTGALTHRLLGRVLDDARLLWSTLEASRDLQPIRDRRLFRYPDDLRYRMDVELRRQVPHRLSLHVTKWVEWPVTAQLVLPDWFFTQHGHWDLGQHLGPTDPDRVRLALAQMGEQLPGPARARLRRLLAAEDVLEPWPSTHEYSTFDGHVLAPWLAGATLLHRVWGPALAPGGPRELLEAYRDANAAGPWWPGGDAVVVAERPRAVHSELIDSPGGPRPRLHAEDGPAVVWDDGTGSYWVHDLHVPFDLMARGWPVERILAERNTELRRIAIERLGWDRFVVEANLVPVHGPVPDPGNPGNTLTLYDLPASYGRGQRLLLCTNASPDRDGTVRRFGLHVPAAVDDAVAAAAWTFDLDRRTYEGLEHAT